MSSNVAKDEDFELEIVRYLRSEELEVEHTG